MNCKFCDEQNHFCKVGTQAERDFVKFVCKDVTTDAVRRQVCWSWMFKD